jgi:hypothetical protein
MPMSSLSILLCLRIYSSCQSHKIYSLFSSVSSTVSSIKQLLLYYNKWSSLPKRGTTFFWCQLGRVLRRRHDSRYNDIYHNYTQHNYIKYNDTRNCCAEFHLCWVSQKSPLCWVSLCWLLLCWISLCWMSWRPSDSLLSPLGPLGPKSQGLYSIHFIFCNLWMGRVS